MGLKPALLSILLLLLANPAWGDEECRLNLSESRVDFGLINRADVLTPAAERLLGERRFSLTLNCPKATDMSVFYRGVAASAQRFRFTERGSYSLHVGEALLDGQAVELGSLAGSGQAPGTLATSLPWLPGHGIVPMRGGAPATGRSLSVQIRAGAWASEEAMRVTDAVTWEASGLFDAPATGRSRELNLQARFAPVACTPTLSNGGHVPLGDLSINQLNATRETVLPPRPVVLNVTCDARAAIAIRMQDNRAGSATGSADDSAYGLGFDASGNKIGRYRLSFDPQQTTADGLNPLYRTDSTNGGVPWSSASAGPLAVAAGHYLGFTAIAGGTGGPDAIQNLSATASLEAVIAPLNTLDQGSEVRLDGSGTLEIKYN